MRLRLYLFLLLFVSAPSWAQAPEPAPCHPWQNDDDYTAVVVDWGIEWDGLWGILDCYPNRLLGVTEVPQPTRHIVASLWTVIDLRRLGDRMDTVRKAPDKSAAWRTAWKRYVTLPLSDPSLQPLREAIATRQQAQAASAAASAASAP